MTGWSIRWQIRNIRARFPWMTVHLLAIRAGLSVAALRRLETGRTRTVSLETLRRLCLALECTPGDLLSFAPDTPVPGATRPSSRHPRHRSCDMVRAA